jgi:hypothetical protein
MSAKVDFLRDLAAVLEKHGAWMGADSGLPTVFFRDLNDSLYLPFGSSADEVRDMADQIEKQEKGGG